MSAGKKPGAKMTQVNSFMQLWSITDKGRLLTDGTVKSHTVVEFTSGKGYRRIGSITTGRSI